MKLYSFDEIKEIAERNGLTFYFNRRVFSDFIDVYLNEFCISTFKNDGHGIDQYRLLNTYTTVEDRPRSPITIEITGLINGDLFFGDLGKLYENLIKNYRKLKNKEKAKEIKKAGAEYELV